MAKATTCKDAIKALEAEKGVVAAEQEKVRIARDASSVSLSLSPSVSLRARAPRVRNRRREERANEAATDRSPPPVVLLPTAGSPLREGPADREDGRVALDAQGVRALVPEHEQHREDQRAERPGQPEDLEARSSVFTLVPVRPRSRGERRSLRTFAVVSLRPGSLAFNTRPRRLSTPLLTPFNSTFSLGKNLIKKIENLDGVAATLEELWISYNNIEKLTNIDKLTNLRVLYMSNNKVADFKELEKLSSLANLSGAFRANNKRISPGVLRFQHYTSRGSLSTDR